MGLWEEAEEAKSRADWARMLSAEQIGQRSRSQAAHEERRARHTALIAEFIDGMRRLGKAPETCDVYTYSSSAGQNWRAGSVDGWVIAVYHDYYDSTPYYIVVTPDGSVLDTRNQRLGKKPMFGRAPIIRHPMSLPVASSYELGRSVMKESHDRTDGTTHTVPPRLDFEAALKRALVSAMRS